MTQSDFNYDVEAQAYWNSPQMKIAHQLEALRRVSLLHQGNHRDLTRLMDAFTRDESIPTIWDADSRENLTAFIDEATRLLHNFVASAQTLVDHTRRHVKKLYENGPFVDEYEQRVALLIDLPERRLVKDLRDYTLHYRLPGLVAELTWTKYGVVSEFLLESAKLLEWEKTSRISRDFLVSHGEHVSLRSVVDAYMAGTAGLYAWMEEREQDIHREDLQWLASKAAELDAVWRGDAPASTEPADGKSLA